jgi:hypothetical protein
MSRLSRFAMPQKGETDFAFFRPFRTDPPLENHELLAARRREIMSPTS